MCVRKLHKRLLHVANFSGPVEVHVDAIVTPELGFVQVVITTCNPLEKLTLNTILAATHGLVLTHGALQELYKCISTRPRAQYLHQLPQLISGIQ